MNIQKGFVSNRNITLQLAFHYLTFAACSTYYINKHMTKRLSNSEYILRARTIHGEVYDYSDTIYEKATEKISILCKKHGKFNMFPYDHLSGKGCKLCGIGKTSNSKRYITSDFVKKLEEIHGNAFNYGRVEYVDCHTPVKIECGRHGVFDISPQSILRGRGCPSCAKERMSNLMMMTREEFIRRSIIVHGGKYDYTSVIYTGSNNRVKIKCLKHNEYFLQLPLHHLRGVGCPICKESKGENSIREYLNNKLINYIPQYQMPECRNILPLPFDFKIEINGITGLIEYNGIQHYKSIKYFGGDAKHLQTVQCDTIKKEYARLHNIPLLIIKYTDFAKINEILDDFISSLTLT